MGNPEKKKMIKDLVDEGEKIDKKIKKLEKELNNIKKQLKAHAKRYELNEIKGNTATVIISESNYSTVNPIDLFNLLKKLKLYDKRFDLINVKIKDTRSFLGEINFDLINVPSTIEYNKCSFKEKGGK